MIHKLFERIAPATEPNDPRIFVTSVYYSLIHLGMMTHAFFTGAPPPPYAMIVIHSIFVALLYALPKEYARWTNGDKPSPPRPGHVLVLLWFMAFVAMCCVQYATEGFYKLPEGMTDMTAILLGTLGVTYLSKRMHIARNPCAEAPPAETKTPT